MLLKNEPSFFCNFGLAFLDFFVEEFFNTPALQADKMIVMISTGKFKYRFATFKVMTLQ